MFAYRFRAVSLAWLADIRAHARPNPTCHAPDLHACKLLRTHACVRTHAMCEAELQGRLQSTLDSLKGVAPCHRPAWIRAVCCGWVTGWRRGHGVKACPLCGLPAARCTTLWAAVSCVTGVPRPGGALEAVGLARSAAAPGQSRGRGTRPPFRILAVTMASDVYHKVAVACRCAERERRAEWRARELRRICPL